LRRARAGRACTPLCRHRRAGRGAAQRAGGVDAALLRRVQGAAARPPRRRRQAFRGGGRADQTLAAAPHEVEEGEVPMSTFMPYVLLVSCVVAAAAVLAERALGAFERPTRGVWLAALLASAVLPVVALTLNDTELNEADARAVPA